MIVQIAAISFIALWFFWGRYYYRDYDCLLIGVLGGLLAAAVTTGIIIIAVFILAAAMGYFS